MHLSLEDQLVLKQNLLLQAFALADMAEEVKVVSPLVASPVTTHYRYKANLKAGSGQVGLNRLRSEQVLAIPECQVLANEILSAIPKLLEMGEFEADFPLVASKACEKVAARVVTGKKEGPVPGLPHVVLEDYGFGEMELLAKGFAQANPFVTALIISDLVQTIGSAEYIVEVYAGSGTLTLGLAKVAKKIMCFEIEKAAVKALQRNTERLKLENVKAVQAEASKVKLSSSADWMVVDPPRGGMDGKLLSRLVSSEINHLAYVSCNPVNLARDARKLIEGGFKMVSLKGYDMYVYASHLETLAIFERD